MLLSMLCGLEQAAVGEKIINAAKLYNPSNPFSRKTVLAGSKFHTAEAGVAALRFVFIHINDKWEYLEPLLSPHLKEAQQLAVAPTTGQATNLYDSDEEEVSDEEKMKKQQAELKRRRMMKQTAFLRYAGTSQVQQHYFSQ